MIKKLLLFVVAAVLSSCASSGPGAGTKPPKTNPSHIIKLTGNPDFRSMDDISKAFGNKVKITGTTVDLQGGELNGSKLKKSSNSQDENNTPVKLRVKNLTIKNGFGKDLPGGLVAYESNVTFENLIFTGTSEDFVSNAKDVSDNLSIIKCKFYNNSKGDKSAQANGAVGLLVRDCYITGGITAIRIGESTSKRHGEARVENCMIEGVPTFLNVDGKMKVYVKGNTLKNVGKDYVVKDGSKVIE